MKWKDTWLAASVFVVAAIACGGGPRDNRPPEVKAAAEKVPSANGGDEQDATARASYLGLIQLRNIKAGPYKDGLGRRKASVEGELKNIGDRSVDRVQITVYFLDSGGKRVHEDTYLPVLANNQFSMNDAGPLKPNYARAFAAGLDVPSEWAGKVEVKVTDVVFTASSPTK